MEATLSQVLAVLSFSHYYLLDRLRDQLPDPDFKLLLDRLMAKHADTLQQQYEVLCLVGVRTKRGLVFTYETQSNVRSGVVNIYEGDSVAGTHPISHIQEVHVVALYHKAMPLEDIVALAKNKRHHPTTKLHTKLFHQAIDVENSKSETLTNPSPNPVPASCFATPLRKVTAKANPEDSSSGKQFVAISRKLMLISDSDSEQEKEGGGKEKKEGSNGEEGKDREPILNHNNHKEKQDVNQTHEKTKKKTRNVEQTEMASPSPSKSWLRHQKTLARKEEERLLLSRQSAFMNTWLEKR